MSSSRAAGWSSSKRVERHRTSASWHGGGSNRTLPKTRSTLAAPRWVLGIHQHHDRHDGRMIHLGSSHWIRDQLVAAGPVLCAPLDPSIYSAAEAYQREVAGTASSRNQREACHQKRGAAEPWSILIDDDSATEEMVAYLTAGGTRRGHVAPHCRTHPHVHAHARTHPRPQHWMSGWGPARRR